MELGRSGESPDPKPARRFAIAQAKVDRSANNILKMFYANKGFLQLTREISNMTFAAVRVSMASWLSR